MKLFFHQRFFALLRFHIDVILIAKRFRIKRHIEHFSFENIFIFFEILFKFFSTCRLRFVVLDIVVFIIFIIFIVVIFLIVFVTFIVVIVVIIVISLIIVTWRRRQKTFSTRWTHNKQFIKQQKQRRHVEMITNDIHQSINYDDVRFCDLDLTHFKFFKFRRLIMKSHFFALSNICLHDLDSSLSDDNEKRKLRTRRLRVDDDNSSINNVSLCKQNI